MSQSLFWRRLDAARAALRQAKVVCLSPLVSAHEEPVIVLGHQKSGTTVIAALLGRLTGLPTTIDPLYNIDQSGEIAQRLVDRDLPFDTLVNRYRYYFTYAVIKDPDFTFLRAEVVQRFPEARVLFVVRDPRDNIRSILNRLDLPGHLPQLGSDQVSRLRTSMPFWSRIVEGRLPRLEGGSYIEILAQRWKRAAEVHAECEEDVILLRYEDFLGDETGTLDAVARRLGLRPINDIRSDLKRQYQPKGDRTVSWREFFGAQNLARIESICGEGLRRYGYEP